MEVDMKPLISVIIPVYNVERYLKQCLNSVIRQTYENLEIICVNDGSTDNSLAILKEYEQKDHRIVVISQENKGLSAARNTGLTHVTSDYVSFIDSDDYIDPRYIEVLYTKLHESNADFSLCDILPFGNNIYKNLQWIDWCRTRLKWSADIPINPNNLVVMSWAKLFKMDVIRKHNLQFPEGLFNEDNYWHFLYCAYSKKYAIAHEKLYFYRKDNPDSIMTKTIYQQEHCYDILEVCCRIFNSLSTLDTFTSYHQWLDNFFFIQLYRLLQIHQKQSIDKIFWNEVKKYLLCSKTAKEKFYASNLVKMVEDKI